MQFGERTINDIGDAVLGLMLDHQEDLDAAYALAADGFTIRFAAKVKLGQHGNESDVDISFVKERIKDTAKRITPEDQIALFDQREGEAS